MNPSASTTPPLLMDNQDDPSGPGTEGAPALVPAPIGSDVVNMFERLATNPAVDVEKLQRLIDMQKELVRINAESEFWAAFAEMQGDLPTITEDGAIAVGGQVRSRYSTNENIQEVIRPILKQYGFALSFRNESTEKGVKVIGILAHRGGHKERDEFESKPDDGGQMNSIQRIGSTRSYGQRYTTIALLNIVSRAPQDRDRDGDGADAPSAPAGYDAWTAGLEGVADEGLPALTKAFNVAKRDFRDYITKHDRALWSSLKDRASKVRG